MREPHPSRPDSRPGPADARSLDSDQPSPVADDCPTEPIRLPPLLSRRHTPWLLVEVDGSTARHGSLVWALREAARREATVLAVTVLRDEAEDPLGTARPPSAKSHAAALQLVEAQVLLAIAETGVHGRVRTAVLEPPVFDALSAATCGADLVIVGNSGKTLLRPAVARPPVRRLRRGA